MKDFIELFTILFSVKFSLAISFSWKEFKRRLYSDESFLGLKYDLTQELDILGPKIPLSIRKQEPRDITNILNLFDRKLDYQEFRNRLERNLFAKANVPTCYVAVTEHDVPCAMCWLIYHEDNDKLQGYFNGAIPDLKHGEVLCENIFTHRDYRGMNLMYHMTMKLFEMAKQKGAQKALAFIRENNLSSLKGSTRIGWEPFIIKKVKWRFFKRSIIYSNK